MDEEMSHARSLIMLMGQNVEEAIVLATRGLVDHDLDLCESVIRNDAQVNDLEHQLRDICYTVILTQAPVARDLREVMTIHHMAAELERMGDHCVGIARVAKELTAEPLADHVGAVPLMAAGCAGQVRAIIEALVARDVERARTIAAQDESIDRLYMTLFNDQIELMMSSPDSVRRSTKLIFVAHHLERIADRVTNLAEDLVYLETGLAEELG